MDELDRKLLFLLAENARASFRELSQQVHLSPPAVAARIARLEREGLLLGSVRAPLSPISEADLPQIEKCAALIDDAVRAIGA